MIAFSIATSWDDALIKQLSLLNQKHPDRQIIEVYGSLRSGLVGSARPSYRLPEVSREQAIKHVQCVHQYGLKFNYTLNAPVLFPFDGDLKKLLLELIPFIEWLQNELGIDSITVTHPDIIQLIKNKFPALKLIISVVADVNTLKRAKEFEAMGADLIYLNAHTANRDFKTIKQVIDNLKCSVGLYANISCLDHCPLRNEHYEYLGFASQSTCCDEIKQDPFYAVCYFRYLHDLAQFLKTPFIRPEDIEEYKKIGITLFKLSDRADSTATLIRTAEAYLAGEFHGDLFDLIFRKGKKFNAALDLIGREVDDHDYEYPITIDNDKLTAISFIQKIKKLHGAKLNAFYREAMEHCLTIMGKKEGEIKIE
jgi:collagenase-like PrtC family protease